MNEQWNDRLQALRSGLSVRLDRLHEDAQRQPSLAEEAGETAASLRAEARRKRLYVDETKSHVERAVRADPESHGLTKTTEAAIASAVTGSADVIGAQREAIAADELADKAVAVRDAYEHRKRMIGDEVRLYLANYWGDIEEREMDRASGATAGQRESRIRRRRAEKRKRKEPEDE